MATLTNGTNLNASIILEKQSGTKITFNTGAKYIEKNIELDITAPSANPNFNGGELVNKNATATFTNLTTSSTNTSGASILTKGTAGRAAVSYNGALNGWINIEDNAIASNSISDSTWDGTTYYITGITLNNGKSFNVTVPNGNSTITFNFTVDNNGNTTITEGE